MLKYIEFSFVMHCREPRTILEGLWRLERLPSVGSWMLQSRVMQPLKPVGCFVFEIHKRAVNYVERHRITDEEGKIQQNISKHSKKNIENVWKHIDIETNACIHTCNKHLNMKLDQYDLWHYFKRSVDLHKMLSLIARPIGFFSWSFSSPEARECSIFPQVVCRDAKIKWFWVTIVTVEHLWYE